MDIAITRCAARLGDNCGVFPLKSFLGTEFRSDCYNNRNGEVKEILRFGLDDTMHLQEIQKELDYYQKLTPTNFAEERAKFFECLKIQVPYNPEFEYNDKLEVEDYEEIKKTLKKQRGRDAIINAFLDVHLDVTDLMIAWKKNRYTNVSILSGQLFGSTKDFELSKAEKLYEKLIRLLPQDTRLYNDKQIAQHFKDEFKKRHLEGWRVEYNEANGGNVSIYEVDKKVVIRTGAVETKLGVECILAHELDGHAFQAFNAMADRRYDQWFLSYLGTERQYEGFATFVVINKLPISHINRELKHNLAFMIATAYAQRLSFWDTFQKMYQICADKNISFFAAYKAKRGFRVTSQPGCFQKENAYLLGALEVIGIVEEAQENYYRLSQGCFPLAALRHVSDKRPKWISIDNFNQDNIDYFKRSMMAIINSH
ncbi:MAG: tyrosine/phenylalanine carboxypeptidase domain-containing protein [Desulfobacterales bacterium]